MLKRMIPVIALGTLVASSAAYAAALSLNGVIKSVDTAKYQVVLKTGETFKLAKTFDLKKLKAGEKVTVSYEKKGVDMMASDVQPAK